MFAGSVCRRRSIRFVASSKEGAGCDTGKGSIPGGDRKRKYTPPARTTIEKIKILARFFVMVRVFKPQQVV
jgi:hypothetical protein